MNTPFAGRGINANTSILPRQNQQSFRAQQQQPARAMSGQGGQQRQGGPQGQMKASMGGGNPSGQRGGQGPMRANMGAGNPASIRGAQQPMSAGQGATTSTTIKHIYFDCDNTLVLSEKLAFEACAKLANEILLSQNVSKRYTGEELVAEFVGQNFRGMMGSIQKVHNFTLDDKTLTSYVDREVTEVIKKIKASAQECPGSSAVLEELADQDKYNMAVVSSSAGPRVIASIVKVGQDKYFTDGRGGYKVYSAATSLPKPTSKPNPAVYLHALKELGGRPESTVAVEDSKSGASAAKNAGLWVIAYVGAYDEHEKEEKAQMLMQEVGCHQLMWEWDEFYTCLSNIEKSDPRPADDLQPRGQE